MTVRNLDKLLAPASVALIGGSARAGSVGLTVARNLMGGGFAGRIDIVSAHASEIDGLACVSSIDALRTAPDLAVIATPPDVVPAIAQQLAAMGTGALVVITAGLDASQRQATLDAGRSACVRVLGPNCIGLLVPPLGLNASFAHITTRPGKLAFLSQSGALVTAVIDFAAGAGIGFSHIVSLGDMSDVDLGDLLDYLASDATCGAILMYVEAIRDARKFMSAARRAARVKPVIAIKAGRHAAAAKAALSHTGALAGSDAAYDAAFARAGILRVRELLDLFAAAEMLAHAPQLRGERLAILTNGGGAGVLAADDLADLDGTLADLAPATIAALDGVLPRTWSRGNPVDIIGDADASRYCAALDRLCADPNTDAILVMNCPTALSSNIDIARAVVGSGTWRGKGKALLTNWLGADSARVARKLINAAHVPTFDTPAEAIDGFMQLVRHKRGQDALMRTPPALDVSLSVDKAAADAIITSARTAGRTTLSELEGKALLAAYGIPVVATRRAANADEAAAIARGILATAPRVALKILSDDISHKSDVGGVMLGLATPDAVALAANAMLERVRAARPAARIAGFTVSEQIERPAAHELIIGMTVDATFGPLVLFGSGGVAVEAIADTALALPPIDLVLADDVIRQTRVWRLLQGFRDHPAADLAAIREALVRLSALVVAHPDILELDINPLLADAAGVIALDARVKIRAAADAARVPMAVTPYPVEWQSQISIEGLGPIRIRPVLPEDESLYGDFFARVSMEDRRLRLFAPVKELTHRFLARMTQIDYAREIGFVAVAESDGALLGVVRYIADPDLRHAEFAALVRSDLKGRGIGWRLMHQLVAYAKAQRLEVLTGDVLEENANMLQMCAEMGFTRTTDRFDPGVVKVRLDVASART